MDVHAMALNASSPLDLPPLPSYTTQPLPPLVPGIPDKYLTLICPVIAYWVVSGIFHVIDELDLFPQYRLHTPAEILKRNHATRYEVFRDVLLQQVIQTITGIALAMLDPEQVTGMDDYYMAVWAQRIRIAQRVIPTILATVGLDASGLAGKAAAYSPDLASALRGGQYSTFTGAQFAQWEMSTAYALYWYLVPAAQFIGAIIIVDTWQYFLHRAMHMNKYLYNTFHSRHHRLYVPYAYGALYNHPFEGFLLDTCGTGLAYLLVGLTPRQSMWFFAGSTIKTVDDHCGYALPFDPLQHLTKNNAGYHDVHHQSWGIKTNFSQPFFTFWDHLLGTVWTGGDVSARYERARLAAQKKVDQDKLASQGKPVTGSNAIDSVLDTSNAPYDSAPSAKLNSSAILPQPPAGKATAQANDSRRQVLRDRTSSGGAAVLAEETAEEQREINCLPAAVRPPSSRKKGSGSQSGLKGLRERVGSGSLL